MSHADRNDDTNSDFSHFRECTIKFSPYFTENTLRFHIKGKILLFQNHTWYNCTEYQNGDSLMLQWIVPVVNTGFNRINLGLHYQILDMELR
jgi:hypothetical protein